jgi:hypothetical protein
LPHKPFDARATMAILPRGGFDGDGPTIMYLRAWQGGIRDVRADWRDWSRAERIAAGLLLAATVIAGVLLLSQL